MRIELTEKDDGEAVSAKHAVFPEFSRVCFGSVKIKFDILSLAVPSTKYLASARHVSCDGLSVYLLLRFYPLVQDMVGHPQIG